MRTKVQMRISVFARIEKPLLEKEKCWKPAVFPFATKALSSMVALPITRRQNFRLVQIEKNRRRHFEVHLK